MSFRLKTILGIAIIESVLLLVLLVSGMSFLSRSNEAQLQQRIETSSILFSQAIQDAVLAKDLATLESFTQAIQHTPDIVYTRISAEGYVLAEGGNAQALNGSRQVDSQLADVHDGIYDIRINVVQDDAAYGVIEMGISTQPIEVLFSQARRWSLAIASIEVGLVAIFSFILGTYLTQQLQQLKLASDTIASAGPGLQISVRGSDEIAEVAHAFNTMSSTLAVSYAELSRSIATERDMTAIANSNQAKNKAILTASLDALITIDEQGKVIDYNEVASSTFGWQHNEIIGQTLADFIIPEHKRKAHHQGILHYLTQRDSPVINQRLELHALHKLGHQFPIEINIAPIETPQGTMFTAFIRDISARLAAQTELRLAAQTFESSEAIFICTAAGDIIRANQAFSRITGYSNNDVIGKNPRILSSGRHDADYYRAMWATLQAEGKWHGEIYNKRKNGVIFPEHLNISAVRDDQGEVSHYIAHLFDISKQKQNEKHLRKARLEAEASNRAKSRFLATMSHEIRTPMNAVLGILALLQDTLLTPQQRSFIKIGQDSGELLLSIINDILDFTKMDIDKLALEYAPLDLPQLLTKSTALLQHMAQEKGLDLRLSLSADIPQFVHGDAERIRQILINLINNAIKFTARGHIHISASAEDIVGNEVLFHCQVSDSGIGISAENQNSLFDEFTMVDQSHSRGYEGTGLGLAICKRLINLMRGKIEVSSQLGQGSTFSFSIPIQVAHINTLGADLNAHYWPAHPRAGTRVLLAEDNQANQRVIKSILEFANLDVTIVDNGKEAVAAVCEHAFDIVLMDISMPQMDGMTACRAIRQLAGSVGKIPIVALTAHTLRGDKDRFLQAGMNDYLSKPIDRSAALACISRWTNLASNVKEQDKTWPGQLDSSALAKDDYCAYVDEAVLQQLVHDTNVTIVPELLTLYIEDSQQRMAQFSTALVAQDLDSLQFEAHTIGSSAAAHGNSKLYELARHIETLCKENNLAQAIEQASSMVAVADKSFQLLAKRAQQGFTDDITNRTNI